MDKLDAVAIVIYYFLLLGCLLTVYNMERTVKSIPWETGWPISYVFRSINVLAIDAAGKPGVLRGIVLSIVVRITLEVVSWSDQRPLRVVVAWGILMSVEIMLLS